MIIRASSYMKADMSVKGPCGTTCWLKLGCCINLLANELSSDQYTFCEDIDMEGNDTGDGPPTLRASSTLLKK